MRGRRRPVRPRRSFFIAGEGQSERPFARFLQHLCDEAGLHVHLDIKPQDGGGSVAVIEQAGRWLKRNRSGREYQARLVLLDRDRIEAEPQEGIQARSVAARYKLEIVFQDPNLEGLLVRLHTGQEQRRIAASDSESDCVNCGLRIKSRRRPSSYANTSRWPMFGGQPYTINTCGNSSK